MRRTFITLVALMLCIAAQSGMRGDEKMIPPYPAKSNIGIYGKKTGFFHVEKIGDRWWTIDPAGNAFFIIGTDHCNYNVHWCEALGYAPYHKNMVAKYGSEEKWADNAVKNLMRWNFNSLAANNSTSTRHKGLAHMEFLGIGAAFSSVEHITVKTFWTGFPNVFSPKWEEYCDQETKARCAPHKDDPWLIGYFIDNELEWFGKTGSLFNDAFAQPADHTAKIALINLLKKRYKGDISAFNKVWSTDVSSFDDLLKLTAAPKSAESKAEDDVFAFAKLCADRYFAVACAAIRKHDPNHMVLGCRFAGRSPGVWSVAGKYCDIVSVNCYRTLDLDKGVMTDDFAADLAAWHKNTNRPLMITEWSFPGLDAGLPSEHGAGQRVKTQADRARAFTIFQKLLLSTPFVVGSDYFMWVDEPALGISKAFPEDSNYGLVDVNDRPYEPITQAATKLHARAYDIHSGNVADVYAKPAGKRGVFIIGNKGKAAAKCKVTTWVDGVPTEGTMDLAGGASQRLDVLAGRTLDSGGHLLMCRVESDDPLVEPNPADNEAHSLFYMPDLSAERRIPVLIANLTDIDMENQVVSIKLSDLRMTFSRDASASELYTERYKFYMDLPSQIIPTDSLVFSVQKLWSRRCATLYVRPGVPPAADWKQWGSKLTYEPDGKGLKAGNGVLSFTKGDTGGSAFDRIEYNGVEVGSFTPLIYQQAGQDFWLRPDRVEKVEVSDGPVALVLDMTFVYTGGKEIAITEVDGQGKSAEIAAHPLKYRAKYRFTINPDKPYFTSRCLWIENSDTEPWKLQSYFHYALSNIAGDSSDDKPRSRCWLDEKAKLCYGVAIPEGFQCNMWKDEAGSEHADAYRYPYLEKTLKPGERFTPDDGPLYVITGDEDAFENTSRRVKGPSALAVKICDMEVGR